MTLPIDDHGIYISVIEINHNSETGMGQVIIKTFSDDLANALRAMNFNIPQDVDACKEAETIESYIDHHFGLTINSIEVPLEFKNCQIENDTHWIYLEYKSTQALTQVNVFCDWLCELFVTQQNIIKLQSETDNAFDRLTKDKTSANFDF